MADYGHVRAKVYNNTVTAVAPIYTGNYTKANGWSDVRFIKIPFDAIDDSKYVYNAGKTVPEIGNLNTDFNLWVNASFVYGTAILGKTIVDQAAIASDIVGKTEQRKHFFLRNGEFGIGRMDTLTGTKFAAQAGPLLLVNGAKTDWSNNPEVLQDDVLVNINPKTLIGCNATHLILAFVDGRGSLDRGMNNFEAQDLMLWLGATDALSMDGGGSSTIFTKNAQLQTALDMKSGTTLKDTHVCDTRAGISPRDVSHGIGFKIDLNIMFPPPPPDPTTFKVTKIAEVDINGVKLGDNTLPPLVINGSTYIPLRKTSDAVGGTIAFAGQKVLLTLPTNN